MLNGSQAFSELERSVIRERVAMAVANLRILEFTEIKTVPYMPLSHPFVERLIGTIRREYLDRMLFWTMEDLERKLLEFQHYYEYAS